MEDGGWELPLDVIRDEILPKLPASSLLRFKCVCESWYDIIISPSFIDTHYATNKHKQASFYYHSSDYFLKAESDTTFSFRIFDTPKDLTIRGYTYDNMHIVGCSKGVVCLSLSSFHALEHDFALWNPATNQFRRIGPEGAGVRLGYYRAGFCFDPVKNTFKVLATSVSFQKEIEVVTASVSTFTLNTNSWSAKEFDTTHLRFPGCDKISNDTTCSNRCMYWTVGYHNKERRLISKYILYYDMVDEVFGRINSPCPLGAYACLASYKDSVAVIARSGYDGKLDSYRFEVWVLMEEDSRKSWSKKLTCIPQEYHVKYPLGFFGNADEVNLVVLIRSDFYLCNMKTGAVTELFGKTCPGTLFQFSESLALIC